MCSQIKPKLEDLIDVLYSDYGSLHIKREPAKRHGIDGKIYIYINKKSKYVLCVLNFFQFSEFLHSLLHKPKIDIETIQVSRRVILEAPEVNALKKNHRSRLQRLVLRRRGILIERPTRPR